MKDELFQIFTFCSKNNIEFELENNKNKENWVNYNPNENKVSVIIADFENKNLDILLSKFLKELKEKLPS